MIWSLRVYYWLVEMLIDRVRGKKLGMKNTTYDRMDKASNFSTTIQNGSTRLPYAEGNKCFLVTQLYR